MSCIFVTIFIYASCFRISHFREWAWDADVKEAYLTISDIQQRCGGNCTAFANGLFAGSMNFYRSLPGGEHFPEFEVTGTVIPGRDLYVLLADVNADFIRDNRLTVLQRGASTALVVAGVQMLWIASPRRLRRPCRNPPSRRRDSCTCASCLR